MIRCAITNGRGIGAAALARADWVQVREKEMPARALTELARGLTGRGAKVIVNTRADVALAAGAAGVHLPAGSVAPAKLREMTGTALLIGVSCHSIGEAEQAEREGADYVFLSPVFPSPSKPGYGPPLGTALLAEACRRVRIPVLALGGVNEDNAGVCVAAGAAGFASISAFAD
ncbi:MAG TPA: thiamine phosphate synthase [Bryobacteraceae bacterium]|nr:thiamine phosphate synthase [Bryobacteraceae bacterium]